VAKDNLEIDVLGDPQPQARARTVSKQGRTWSYSPKNVWKELVSYHMKRTKPLEPMAGNLNVLLMFRMPRPKSVKSNLWWMNKRPDWDNLAKAVTDAMQDSGWIEDDGQIVRAQVTKRYPMPSEAPGCLIRIEKIKE